MKRWPIERRWQLQTGTDHQVEGTTADLVGKPACCLLGAAGLGKTLELENLENRERGLGYNVLLVKLGQEATSPDRLDAFLNSLAGSLSDRSVLYLDAVDEAMVPVVRTSQILSNWICRELKTSLPLLRITCRSGVWPQTIESAIRESYGESNVTIASLLPLEEQDVLRVAESEGVDGRSFLEQVNRSRVDLFARQPLTLDMLLRLFRTHGVLPTGHMDLFKKAVDLLSIDREERRESGTAGEIEAASLLEAAERLACFSILSGREEVDLGDDPNPSSLGLRQLAALPTFGGSALDYRILKSIGRSGLCEGVGASRFRFVHRQFAEYLAGRRIALLPFHQSRSLLSSNLGWREGVAGPLRETAAFAANMNLDLARWVSETDPEIVGLTEVADPGLRRSATMRLLERCRKHQLTDSQVGMDRLVLDGLRYDEAELDLRPILRERGEGLDDVLELAIELVEKWQVTTLHGDLSDLVLDPLAPLQSRIAAGYVLKKTGHRDSKRRLRPLIDGSPEDENEELKGIALQCCWPDDLGTRELLVALRPGGRRNFIGAYVHFFLELERSGFDASADRVEGLAWARSALEPQRHYYPASPIIQRIAQGALAEIDDPVIVAGLAALLWDAVDQYAQSPLRAIDRDFFSSEEDLEPAPMSKNGHARRVLLAHLLANSSADQNVWYITHKTPGFLDLEDFSWLLGRACDLDMTWSDRERYAELASTLPIERSSSAVDAWLKFRECEPVKSKLNHPLSSRLDGEEAERAREFYRISCSENRVVLPRRLEPSASERVARTLELAETKDPKYFFHLCKELTLSPESIHFGFNRFPSRTPGWEVADVGTRLRIVDAAKRVLTDPVDEPESCGSVAWNSVSTGPIQAVWLLVEEEAAWFDKMTPHWWERWCWCILGASHPDLHGEPKEPKLRLYKLFLANAPQVLREAIVDLSSDIQPSSRNLLTSLLDVFQSLQDPVLEATLARSIEEGTLTVDRVREVLRFLLNRDRLLAMATCRNVLEGSVPSANDELVLAIGSALLQEETSDTWDLALSFLRRSVGLAKLALGRFAHTRPSRGRGPTADLPDVTANQLAELCELLLEHYPPGEDPKYEGAFSVTEDDSAIHLRTTVINRLAALNTEEAVEAARKLERRFGLRDPWLRRVRSEVERAYRQSNWTPISPEDVGSLLNNYSMKLLRSPADVVEGICTAIERFGRKLRVGDIPSLEDLWNTPREKGARPSPKDEERVSDKLCLAIREYFSEYAVSAEREVQVSRRLITKASGGEPGSEADILVRVLPTGTSLGKSITIPIEVKRSDNKEAKTGLRDQLMDRYMRQIDTNYGIFVVVWLDAPNLAKNHRPQWNSIEDARESLNRQAQQLADESNQAVFVSSIVVDASLR